MNTATRVSSFFYHVDHKRILARLINLRHPELDVSKENWKVFNGAVLWGFLRQYPVKDILITCSEPILMVIHMDGEPNEYIRIEFLEYTKFQEYCLTDPKEAFESVWKTEGF